MILNVNIDALKNFTAKLETMHKSAFPSAVRETLNDAVFDVKSKSLLENSKSEFINRQPNFFKANSRFENATGFNVSQMKAIIGMIEGGLKGGNNFAVKDLNQQEIGGSIQGKTFIPLDPARGSSKLVRASNRISGIKNIIEAKKQKAKSKKQQFIQAALKAGNGGYVIAGFGNGENTLWRINSISSKIKGHKLIIKKTPLYDVKNGRSITVKPHHFMEKSAIQSGKKLEKFYEKQFERQLAKLK